VAKIVLAIGFCALCACRTSEQSESASKKAEVTVAAAANLTDVFQQIGPLFEAQTGIHPVFSFASTGPLTQQIENGAPLDVFTAADSQHVDELEKKGLLLPGSRAIYAVGVLALWIPPSSHAPIQRIEDLTSPQVHVIALANPELAPYGEAAIETLRKLGIWDRVKDRVVYGENINVAKQYGTSKNADAVLTAYSLVIHEDGKVIPVDSSLHQPIDQEMGIVAASKHAGEARKFEDFLLKGDGKKILAAFGYH
jgi:molybdate transport system substrate-binding protein